jgi:hypothetical protein
MLRRFLAILIFVTSAAPVFGQNWSEPENIFTSGQDMGNSPDLTIDSDGRWHVVYISNVSNHNGVDSYVNYLGEDIGPVTLAHYQAIYNGQQWTGETADHSEGPSISAGPNNLIHILYNLYNFSTSEASYMYMHNDSLGNWSEPENIFTSGQQVGNSPALTIDSDGRWHVVYISNVSNDNVTDSYVNYLGEDIGPVTLAHYQVIYNGQQWTGEDVATYEEPSISAGPNNLIHILYNLYNLSTSEASYMYMHNDSLGNWSEPENIFTGGHRVGISPDLTIDSDGRWHVVYILNVFNDNVTDSYVNYLGEDNGPVTLAHYQAISNEQQWTGECAHYFDGPSISAGPNNLIHILYNLYNFSTSEESYMYMHSITLPSGTIKGTVLRSDTFTPIWNAHISIDQKSTITDTQGRYIINNIGVGDYTLICNKNGYNSTLLAGVQISANETTEVDLFLTPLARDLSIDLWSEGRARPGYNLSYICHYSSNGLESSDSVNLKIVLSPDVTFLSSQPSGQVSGDSINWYLGILNNIDSGSVQVNLNVPMGIPNNSIITSFASIETTDPESYLINNYDTQSDVVVSSWDPNGKIADPIGKGLGKYISAFENLKYTIFFENEGTGEAVNISIVDTLDPSFDWSTIAFGPMSHPSPCSSFFDAQNGVLYWNCDSIMLPPNINPPEGEGYVSFEAFLKPFAASGTEIKNRAAIKFDYNPWMTAPMNGDFVTRTVDINPPATAVMFLSPQINTDSFIVYWNGADCIPGIGLQLFKVYVSTNNGSYDLWINAQAQDTSRFFHGSFGNCYGFYSIGIDSLGNIEMAPSIPDAQTCLVEPNAYSYTPGDANGVGGFTGLDITYSVRYFKGGPLPPYSCDCPPHGTWYVAGDVNGSCSFTGLDVTYMVRYFKGGLAPIPCPDCPPAEK